MAATLAAVAAVAWWFTPTGLDVARLAPSRLEPAESLVAVATAASQPAAATSDLLPARTIEEPPGEARERARSGSRRARPGSERWHRERFDDLARRDPAEFAREARERLRGDDDLVRKVALLRVARRRDRKLADELFADALDPAGGTDEDVRAAALHLLVADAPRSPDACRRLLELVLADPGNGRASADERRRAAIAFFANADETLLLRAADLARSEAAGEESRHDE